jgi:ketosteroid isomerase-like protein
MNARICVLVAMVVGALAGCQRDSSLQLSTAEEATIRADIDTLRARYEAAVGSGAPESMPPLLADGAIMVAPGAPDWNAMAAAAKGAPFAPGATIAIKPIEVVALSREWAYEFGTSITTYTPEGTGTAQRLRDTYLVLFRNTGDGWKVYREVASAAPPPSGWPAN